MSKKKQVIVDDTNVRFFDYKEYRKLPSALDAVQMTEPFTVVTTKGEKLFGKAGDYLVVGGVVIQSIKIYLRNFMWRLIQIEYRD